MTKITDLEASLEQLKSDSFAYQEATANRFNRMQESIDKNKAKADRQFAELLQLLKNIQPPTTIAPPTTHPNYLHPPSAATPLFSRPPSNPNPNPRPLPHPAQPSPPVGYPNQPPPPPNHTTPFPPPNQITHPPLPPINQPQQQPPPFVPPKPPTALPNPTPPPSINLSSQPPPNQTLQPSRTTTLGYGALNLRGFGLFLFFSSVHITRKGLQNEDHYIWDPGITPDKFIKPHLEDKVLSNFLYYYGMCGLVKELLLMRYFSKEVRGGSIVPEADMVQCCRRSLDEMQSLNVLQFLEALNGRMDITDGLKRLQCRTLIFVGENSPFHLESLHMTSKLDGRFSALVEVGRCGSVVTEEQPDAMLMPLEYFLMGYGVYRPSELNISPRSPLSPTSISPDLYNPESMGLKLKPIKTRVSSSKN